MTEPPRHLHDYELGEIEVDYQRKTAAIHLKNPSPPVVDHVMRLRGLRDFRISSTQPWGGGFYVADSSMEQTDGICFVEFTLNSGDTIKAECEYAAWSVGNQW